MPNTQRVYAATAEVPKKRQRSGIFLVLYLLTSMSAGRVISEAGSTAEQLGALSVPVTLLAFGTYFAFKDKNKVTRVVSVILVLIAVAAFLAGLARGLGGAAS